MQPQDVLCLALIGLQAVDAEVRPADAHVLCTALWDCKA